MNSKEILEIAVKAVDSKHGENIMVLDMAEVSLVADYFVIADASSDRQIDAIVQEVIDKEEEAKVEVKRVEGQKGSHWILVDLGDVILHIFQTEEREFYNLEKLWSQAPLVDINQWLVK